MKRILFLFFTVCMFQLGKSQTVVDIIVNSEAHDTLEVAVVQAGLADDLADTTATFTVFAPTDAAFAVLPAGLLDTLLADPTGDLADILLYHVLGSEVPSDSLSNGQVATTLEGSDITVSIDSNGVFINTAQVTMADIPATNGIVHVINAVLTPPADPTDPIDSTVVDIIVNSAVHETLEAAVIAADLVETLSGVGPFTVFAPTDSAFAALPEGLLDTLLADPSGDLTDILLYHVLGAVIPSDSLSDGQVVTTLGGSDVTVTIDSNGVFINDAKVILTDLVADNGIVHVIDAVLVPPADTMDVMDSTVVDIIVGSAVHETLEAAVIAADLAGTLSGAGPFTVFAPTDSAFAALPEGLLDTLLADPSGDLTDILLYHVLGTEVPSNSLSNGQVVTTLGGSDVTVTIDSNGVFINDAKVILTDLVADNGIVHVIDAVLVPPADTMDVMDSTVVDIIVGSAVHETLEAAVIAADLAGTLSGAGPFTVFAPTDSAFAALPEGLLDTLLADPSGDLTDILLYHVLGAEVPSNSLSNGQVVTTLGGSDVTVTIDSNGVFINDAKVILTDLVADNGIVHVIDAVLVPPTDTMVVVDSSVVDIIVGSAVHETLEAAVIAAGLVDALSVEGNFTVFAPTDSAFAALPEGLLDTLLADPAGDLTNILLYHVLGARVPSDSLSDGQTATTLQGTDITVTIDSNGVFINEAMVIITDIEADNGIVHVIDAVLVPATSVNTKTEIASAVGIEVFPNPTSGFLQVRFPQSMSREKQIQVVSLEGRILGRWATQANEETLSLEGISAGTYLLLIESNEGTRYYQRILLR